MMMTTLDAQTTDVCQCARAKESGENEGDPGTTVIYPDCHLEEETAREHEDAEQTVVKQAALPDEKRVYTAFKSSPSLMRIAAQGPSEQSIRLVIRKRQKGQQTFAKSTRKLVKEFGTTAITTSLKSLLDGGVFMCTDTAKRRFPDLFPEEQVQESAKETIVMCESQPEDRESSEPPGSRHDRSFQDADDDHRRILTHLPIRPRQRLMSQLQLILEHACFAFGQRELPEELDKWGHSCAEAVSLQTWVDLFKQDKMLETEDNAGSISDLLNTVAKIQNVATHRLSVDFDQVGQLLSSAEEFLRLLNTPAYRSAVKQLRQLVQGGLNMVDRNAALAQRQADKKFAQIETQRRQLKKQEEEAKRELEETLENIRESIERDIFAVMRQAKDVLPDIGLADQRVWED